MRVDTAKKLLALCQNNPPPEFELSARGFTIPVVALPWWDRLGHSLVPGQKMLFTVAWKDIEEWKTGYRDFLGIMPPYYFFKTKNPPTREFSEVKKFSLRRDYFTGRDEEVLVNFASRYCSVTPKNIKKTR